MRFSKTPLANASKLAQCFDGFIASPALPGSPVVSTTPAAADRITVTATTLNIPD